MLKLVVMVFAFLTLSPCSVVNIHDKKMIQSFTQKRVSRNIKDYEFTGSLEFQHCSSRPRSTCCRRLQESFV